MEGNHAASPLPDLRGLVLESGWVGGMPGLGAQAARWQRQLPTVRRELASDAAELAHPRVWLDTGASLAATGRKVVAALAPDAPVSLRTVGSR